jgi:molybdenum cofactor sulfurtransferase
MKTLEEFLAAWPEYAETSHIDALRATEYGRLDRLGHVYLDYTGAGLYADLQVREHTAMLEAQVLANPHSQNPTSRAATELVENCRARILEYFCASPDEYVAVFTANASAALKLVGEAFPFAPGSHYLLTFDNHNSVNGIREFARARGAAITYVPLTVPDLRVDEVALDGFLHGLPRGDCAALFAYPAQSNFSGVQHPLSFIADAQAAGWTVLLDAAAFVPTNRLDLSRWHPDFVSVSFYKMLGYPTGVGCLLARRTALGMLHRPWFSGGTISVASVQGDRHFMQEGASAFEDGTPDFLGIPAVEIGLRYLESVGVDAVHKRCRCLTGWLLGELLARRHRNGRPLIHLYGPPTLERRGATVTINFSDAGGRTIDHRDIEEAAARHRISLRTGCFCNPGDGEIALNLTKSEIVGCFSQPAVEASAKFTVDDFRLCVTGKTTGAVRVSLGIASTFADVLRFVQFADEFVDGSAL